LNLLLFLTYLLLILIIASLQRTTLYYGQFISSCLRVIEIIFAEVDKHIDTGDLIQEYKMSALPSLYDHFVKLIKYLVNVLPVVLFLL